jgi:two-component system, LytTR family, response regulator
MNKIRAIIADDEPLARRGIRQLLEPHDDIDVIGEARNGREAVSALRELKPDLVFLDIQMPALDGFGVLRTIGVKQMPAVIFVTAHDQFAVRAFDAYAVDYLVKPLRKVRFTEALERMRERRRSVSASETSRQLSALLAEREKERNKQRILVPTARGNLIIEADEIDWIEADDYYAAIHARQQRHLVRESLTSLAQRLDPKRFIRVHRSAIVNIDRVREVRQDDGDTLLVLVTGIRIPVSRRRRSLTRRVLRRLSQTVT